MAFEHIYRQASSKAKRRRQGRCGFSLLELLIVLLIMGITVSIGVDVISAFEANQRSERAACECAAAFRYARQLAISTSKSTKVVFDTTNKNFSVYWMSNGTTWDASPAAQTAGQNGAYTISMSTAPELKGVVFSLNPAGTTSFIYNTRGSLDNATVITFSCGSRSKVLNVSRVGDPAVQ